MRFLLEDGNVVLRMQDGEALVAESDFLAFHPASYEGPFLPLADFNPGFVAQLLDEHADSRILVVRNGVVCVPWGALMHYSAPGASPLDWEPDWQGLPV